MVSAFYLLPDKYNEYMFISTVVNSHIACNFFKVKLIAKQEQKSKKNKVFLNLIQIHLIFKFQCKGKT